MNTVFYNRLAKSNASTECRTGIRDFVVQNPDCMTALIDFATDLSNKNQHKAIWIMEMLAETHPAMLAPFVDSLWGAIPKFKHESAIRGSSRTVYFLSKNLPLTQTQKEQCIEICLDWLIGDAKVAPKAYAMYALGHYAQKEEWLREELRTIIDKDFYHQSAGYKAAAREVLQKISK